MGKSLILDGFGSANGGRTRIFRPLVADPMDIDLAGRNDSIWNSAMHRHRTQAFCPAPAAKRHEIRSLPNKLNSELPPIILELLTVTSNN